MKKNKDNSSVDVFTDLLKQNLPKLHQARLKAIAIFVLSLISEATVNLQKLALSGLVAAKPGSVCKRFSRLLAWVATAKINFAGQEVSQNPFTQENDENHRYHLWPKSSLKPQAH